MSALQITGSLNVAILDSNIVCDLCAGKFYIDALPSTFIGSGADNIKGIKVKIVNPYGVTVKDYTSAYDIPSTATAIYQFNIPTQAGNYQYGQYLVSIKLVDADDKEHEVTKPVSPCEPDKNNKTKKYGVISATIEGICADAKARVRIGNVPTYKGIISQSQVNDFKLEYPTGSELAPIANITTTVFSLKLFEGQYRVTGTVCATYESGDNVSYKVSYLLDKTKDLRCTIDECCIFEKLTELHQRINSQCTLKEKEEIASITLDVLRLLKTAKLAAACGSDASEYVLELEDLLQCRCSATNDSTPLSDINPTKDFVIQGCNITKETVGLTDTYTIENYEYIVDVNPNGGVVTVSAPQLTECKKTQVITFDITKAYLLIKNIANSTLNEALSWASYVNKALTGIAATQLGITQPQWDAMTLAQRIDAMIKKIGLCCGCDADIDISNVEKIGVDIKASWTNVTSTVSYNRVYLDGVLKATLLGSVLSYTFLGAADGIDHEYLIEPICSNNSVGIPVSGNFNEAGCDEILPPTVSSNNVNAPCPYDLTALVSGLPVGVAAEWHTANNTLAATLVSNPASVGGGTYYVFAKDNTSGCYSSGVQVIVVCVVETSCTAPQNPLVVPTNPITGTAVKAVFSSAAYPPPANSYTVERRFFTDPDVSGSYTILGVPVWNAIKNKWEADDILPAYNTRFLYRYISNCPSTTPYVDVTYARFYCPAMTLSPFSDHIDFSFDEPVGEVDKIEVKLYDATGTILLNTKTILPAFPPTIADTFGALSPSTNYKIKTILYIGTLSSSCSFVDVATADVSALPCADVLLSLSFVNAGSDDSYQIHVELDQPYDQDILIDGYLITTIGNIPFNLTVSAGNVSLDSGYIYIVPAASYVQGHVSSVFPEVATAGGNDYSTQCGIGFDFV